MKSIICASIHIINKFRVLLYFFVVVFELEIIEIGLNVVVVERMKKRRKKKKNCICKRISNPHFIWFKYGKNKTLMKIYEHIIYAGLRGKNDEPC